MDRETITIPAPKFSRGQLVQFAVGRTFTFAKLIVVECAYELSRNEWFYSLRGEHHNQPITVEEISLCAIEEQAE